MTPFVHDVMAHHSGVLNTANQFEFSFWITQCIITVECTFCTVYCTSKTYQIKYGNGFCVIFASNTRTHSSLLSIGYLMFHIFFFSIINLCCQIFINSCVVCSIGIYTIFVLGHKLLDLFCIFIANSCFVIVIRTSTMHTNLSIHFWMVLDSDASERDRNRDTKRERAANWSTNNLNTSTAFC